MKAIQIETKDNVATITNDGAPLHEVVVFNSQGEIILNTESEEGISFGHKIAIKPIERGEMILKYGEVIGVASAFIAVGSWVHTHNVESGRLPVNHRR